MNIAVFGARPGRPFLEAVSAAGTIRQAGDALFLCVRDFPEAALDQAAGLGAERVLDLRVGAAEPGALLEELTRRFHFQTVIFPAARSSRALAALLAQRLGGDCTADCVALERAGDRLRVVKPVYASNALARFTAERPFCAVVLRDKRFPPAAAGGRRSQVETVLYRGRQDPYPPDWVEPFSEDGLDRAEVVVVGGRGIENRDDLALAREFARGMGGAFGATRPLVMSGLVPATLLIGQSGRSIAPRLCITVGVSGSTPFLAGVSPTARLFAIDRDPNANIFAHADYGLTADYRTLLPALMEDWKPEGNEKKGSLDGA